MRVTENIQINNPQSLAGRGFCRSFESTKIQTTMTNLQPPCEVFKPVLGFEGFYEVSNYGRVKSLARNIKNRGQYPQQLCDERFLKPQKGARNYLRVSLYKDNNDPLIISVHRLVALHFIQNENPEKYVQVNHIDGDRNNNTVSNLEWCDQSMNMQHRHKVLGQPGGKLGCTNELCSLSKKVIRLTKDGVEIQTYPSLAEAERQGFDAAGISSCCTGRTKTHRGFKWKHA